MAGKLTCNDKMCAAYVEQADGTVCLQVQVKDPGTTADPKIDTEIQLLCDTGNGDAKFYAAVQYTDAGDFEVIEPIDLTGAPYTVVGPVEICATEDAKIVVTEACDELADGSRVRFYYVHTVQGGAIIASLAIAANGGAYTPVNEIPEVKGEFADDIEVTTVQLCDTGNANEAYLLHSYHNTTTGLTTTVSTELDGTTAYTPIVPGAYKPEGADDIEVTTVELCDLGNNNTPYLLHTYYNTADATTTTATTELDGTTAYNLVQAGSYKPTRCFLTEAYVIDTDGLTNGGNEQFWETGNGAIDAGTGAPIEDSFRLRDACGVLLHENDPDVESVNTNAGLENTDPNDGSGPGNQTHQSRMETYLVVPKGGAEIFYNAVGVHSSLVYAGACGDKVEVVGGVQGSGTVNIGYYPQGVYRLLWFVYDSAGNGRGRIRWKLNGGNVQTIPVDNFYTEMPNITKCTVVYDKDLETVTDIIDGTDIPLTTDGLMFCDPCKNKVSGGVAESAGKDAARVLERERISLADGDTVSLTPPIDSNGRVLANGAIVQVQYIDQADVQSGACVRYRIDGGNATGNNGFLAGHKEYIELGCAASNGATITDDVQEVIDFSLDTAQTTGGVELEVIYYAY